MSVQPLLQRAAPLLDRFRRPAAGTALGIMLVIAAIGLTSGWRVEAGRADIATDAAHQTGVRLDATAQQAGDLAAQVTAACAAGGAGADRLRQVPLEAGRTVDACVRAAQVAASPEVVAAGPTPADLDAAVAAYLAAHPSTGPSPSTSDVTAAIAAYLAEHPPPAAVSTGPTTAQLADAVSLYLAAHPPPAGEPGPAPTQADIAAAVAAYMAAHPPDPCAAGEHRAPVVYQGGLAGSGCVSDDQPAPATSGRPPADTTTPAGDPPADDTSTPATPTR